MNQHGGQRVEEVDRQGLVLPKRLDIESACALTYINILKCIRAISTIPTSWRIQEAALFLSP